MKHIVFENKDKKAILDAQKEIKNSKYKSQLIQIFTAITDKAKIYKIIKKYKKYFPDAIIIGTTTAGEITNAKMSDNSTTISLTLFETTTLKVSYVKETDKKSGMKLSKKISSKHTRAAIILSEGLDGKDYDGFIKGFKKENPNIIVAGGLAGDNFKLKNTFIFLGDTIYDKGSVAVSFSGQKLYADNRYNLNWTPIGKEFTITSSEANIVHKIDNQSAVSLFKKYLGKDIFLDGAKSLPDFQLLFKEGSTVVSRTPLAIDGESLVFAASIKKNQKVQFGFSNAASVLSGSNMISNHIKKNPAQAIYIFSCIARKTLLGKSLEGEFENFESIAPTAGFFTYGEYYSTTKNNALLNCTTTLLVLSESSKKHKKISIKKQVSNLDDVTFSALTHFIKQTSQELNSNVKLLNQYKDAVDTTLLVSKTDKKGYITYVNDNFCRVSQYSRDELIGQKHSIVRDPSLSAFIFKKMWSTIKSGRTWKGKFPNRAKDGSIYHIDATVMPTYSEDKKIDGFIAIRNDITKQVISTRKVKEKEKLIKAIFDNQDSIVIFSSKQEGMININKTFYNYFDFKSFEEFKDKHKCICELFLKEKGYLSSTDDDWMDYVASKNSEDIKVKMKTKSDKIDTFSLKIKKINDDYIINLIDITNLEMALHKAYSSEQAKSTFLANMSHEIRTPLNGILGFTDVLNKRDLDKESKKYVEIIHKSGQSLLNVVNDILDFSKLESGELSIAEVESNLFLEMEAAVSTFASTAKAKNIDYYTYIDTRIPKTLMCDVQRIKQVVNNLISNAIKFTPNGGKVKVTISLKNIDANNATIFFSVRDSGIGIAEDKIDSVFQAFSQADNSISREFGGTGLGLSISNQYTQMMGSHIEVSSQEGKGSEFYFELDFDVIDATNNIQDNFNINTKNISIYHPEGTIACGINEIVETYLDRWECNYTTIHSMDELDENTNMFIVCAKSFDKDKCEEALNKFPKLQLIYIEGGEESFKCSHPKFHLISQPMTGSDLFDTIITLSHKEDTNITEVGKVSNLTNKIDDRFDGKILIAEDNPTNQLLISVMLDERKVDYKIVENGREAVDEALKDDFDLILMDINMPILDGVSATIELRDAKYTKPIVSLSANVIESDVKSYLEAGVDATLNKPIVSKELDVILQKYLVNKVQKLDFDVIDVSVISNSLALNEKIIMKLLNSFAKSAQNIVEQLVDTKLDKNNLHSIKGLAGNLRFNKLFELSKKFEEEVEEWNDNENNINKTIIISHLKEAIKNINSYDSTSN